MSEEAGWVQRNWDMVVFAGATIIAIAKAMVDINDLKTAVYDDHGDTRLVPVAICERCRQACEARAKNDRDNLRIELQNIHNAVAVMHQALAEMPQRMAEHWRNIGLLK